MAFTLDEIRAAAHKKYADTPIGLPDGEVLNLLNALRLPKEKRKALMNIQSKLEVKTDDEGNEVEAPDQEDVLADAIRLVADSEEKAETLLAEIGDDLSVLAEIFAMYTGETELGEASASQN